MTTIWPFVRKGASGFSAGSTAEEVTQGVDGTGLTAIVTGASSDIGAETARVLALRYVHVIMGVDDIESGEKVKESIIKEVHHAKIDVMELDLASLASVRKFASDFDSSGLPLNILINNAGIMCSTYTLSQDGIELQFANYLGHFLLTNLLLENMKNTARMSGKEGRIVNVSSEAYRFSYEEGIRFDKINDKANYGSLQAHGQSKLANVLHAHELTRHFKEEGVELTANSVNPGSMTANLTRDYYGFNGLVKFLGKLMLKNISQGASTTCYVALHPQVKGVSGEYFTDSNIAALTNKAKDANLAKKLWDFSLNLVNSK